MTSFSIRIEHSSRGSEILRRIRDLQESATYQLLMDLFALDNSLYILAQNHLSLRSFLTEVLNDPKHDSLFLPANREFLHEPSLEIARRIHNFVAAAMSLRDHTRTIFHKYYEDNDRFPEYTDRSRSVFATDPIAQFVLGLREYCQHYRSPGIAFTTRVSDEYPRGFLRQATLDPGFLLKYDGWKGPAKRFIRASGGEPIDIGDVSRQYHEMVSNFYTWFTDRQREIHSGEIAAFRAREGELLHLQLEDRIELLLARVPDESFTAGDVFVGTLSREEIAQLSFGPKPTLEQANEIAHRAVALLSSRFPVTPSLEAQVLALFKFAVSRG